MTDNVIQYVQTVIMLMLQIINVMHANSLVKIVYKMVKNVDNVLLDMFTQHQLIIVIANVHLDSIFKQDLILVFPVQLQIV